MENLFEDIVKNRVADQVTFWGVVEDNNDPMTLGRVKVRCFHYHSESVEDIPTAALPWALVLTPTTSASISGIGESPNGLERGSWVYGFFMDGRDAQYPVVTHSVPGVHRNEGAGTLSGTSTGFTQPGNYDTGDTTEANEASTPYNNQSTTPTPPGSTPDTSSYPYTNPAEQGDGAVTAVGDINMMLQPKDGPRFKELGITMYTADPCPTGLACKDGMRSLRFHYGTALALEKLTKNWGRGKFALTSAYRTRAYNSRLKGAAKNSQHVQGRALDIPFSTIGGGSNANLAAFGKAAVKCGFVGFGIYSSFIHIDTGTGRTWMRAKESWFINAIKSAGWYPNKKGLSGISTSQGTAEEPNPDDTGGATDPKITTTNQSQEYVRDRLKAEGYTDAQIAGVMGNLQEESRFNPGSFNKNDRGKPAAGIAQWRDDRRAALYQFTGTKTPNLKQQMDFMIHELNGKEYRARDALRAARTPQEATMAFAKYERYDGYKSPSSKSSRNRLAHTSKFVNGEGFSNEQIRGYTDPTNSLPSPEYRGEPSTNMSARGFNSNSNQRRILTRDSGRMTGFPAAGEVGTFGEPELRAAPQYPYNHTKTSRTGHMIELDDTPGAGRVNIEHASGSGYEMFENGSVSERTQGHKYSMTNGDYYQGVMGKLFMTSVNDMHIRSTADMVLQSDGSMNIHMGNDGALSISGDYLISVGEDFKVRAKKIVFEATDSIDIMSHKSVNIEGKEGVTIKAGKAVEIQGGSGIGLKAPTVYADDVMRVGEDGAKEVVGADSADVGAPPARKVIEKDNLKNSASKATITTEEAAQHYGNRGQR